MTTDLRDILSRVASGDLPPADAARLLGDAPAAAPHGPTASEPTGPAASGPPVRRLVIAAEACKLTVVADPTVSEVLIDGPHGATRDGDTLRIGVGRVPVGAYQFEQRPTGASRRFHAWAGSGATVRMRVNPSAQLDLTSSAAGIEVSGMRSALNVHVGAGSVKVTDHVGPVVGYASTGSISFEGLVRDGESRLECELGSISARLLPGSGVRIRARSELGSISVGGTSTNSEYLVGDGAGSLDVVVRLGSAKVMVP